MLAPIFISMKLLFTPVLIYCEGGDMAGFCKSASGPIYDTREACDREVERVSKALPEIGAMKLMYADCFIVAGNV